MSMGQRIGKMAKDKGMNLHQLAVKAGISYNSLYAIVKRDSKRISIESAKKIAGVLNIPWYELYSDSTEGRIEAIKEEIETELSSAVKSDSDFATLFRHPVVHDLADQVIALQEQRTILTLVQLKNFAPKGQEVAPYEAPEQEEIDRRIRNCIAFALLDHGIKPSGYKELIDLGFLDGDATYLLTYDRDNVPGKGVKTEAQIKEFQDIIYMLNAGARNKGD